MGRKLFPWLFFTSQVIHPYPCFIFPQYSWLLLSVCPNWPLIHSNSGLINQGKLDLSPELLRLSSVLRERGQSLPPCVLATCHLLTHVPSTFIHTLPAPITHFNPIPLQKESRKALSLHRGCECADHPVLIFFQAWRHSNWLPKGKGKGMGIVFLPPLLWSQPTAFLSRSSHSFFKSLAYACNQITASIVAQAEGSRTCTDREFPHDPSWIKKSLKRLYMKLHLFPILHPPNCCCCCIEFLGSSIPTLNKICQIFPLIIRLPIH